MQKPREFAKTSAYNGKQSTQIALPIMTTIYKYPLNLDDEQTIEIQAGFKPLHVGNDPQGALCLWCQVNTLHPKQVVRVVVVGTGGYVPDGVTHVGSAVCGTFVWHVFIRNDDLA